jgi:allantoinase
MNDFDLVLRARRMVTPDGEGPGCVAVRGGTIAAVEPSATALTAGHAGTVVELGDDVVLLPGLVDTHVHVNDPGRADWEGFATATAAAAAGGVTTIVDMPLNSLPPTVDPAALTVTRGRGFLGRRDPRERRAARSPARRRGARLQVLPAALGGR